MDRNLKASLIMFTLALAVSLLFFCCAPSPDCHTSQGVAIRNAEMKGTEHYEQSTCKVLDPWAGCFFDVLPGLHDSSRVTKMCIVDAFRGYFVTDLLPYKPKWQGEEYSGLYWGPLAEVYFGTAHESIMDTALYHEWLHLVLDKCLGQYSDQNHEHWIWTIDKQSTARYMFASCKASEGLSMGYDTSIEADVYLTKKKGTDDD